MGSACQSGPGSPLHSLSLANCVLLGMLLKSVGLRVLSSELENR